MTHKIKTIAILITNLNGGGTIRHLQEMLRAWSEQGCNILYIKVTGFITNANYIVKGKELQKYLFFNDTDGKRLLNLMKFYKVQLLHVEHLLDAPFYFLTLHKQLGIPLVVVMHDYYMICPFITLTNEKECYCGEIGIEACQTCLAKRKIYFFSTKNRVLNILKWRSIWRHYLESAKLVIVPSKDMEERVKKYYPTINLEMKENPELYSYKSPTKRIGLIGNFSIPKGEQKIKDCLTYCADNHENLHFILFGTIPNIVFTAEEKKYITILGPYEEKEVYKQIEEKQIDFFWFPGVCPETYSYTLSIAVRLGIPCISTDIGAIASRIEHNHWGTTYPWQYKTEDIIHELNNFNFLSFRNPNFIIKNTSFGNIEEYYHDIVIPQMSSTLLKKIPESDCIAELSGYYSKDEFHVLWQLAKGIDKIRLLLHIDRNWVKDILKQKGLKYLLSKAFNKYLK